MYKFLFFITVIAIGAIGAIGCYRCCHNNNYHKNYQHYFHKNHILYNNHLFLVSSFLFLLFFLFLLSFFFLIPFFQVDLVENIVTFIFSSFHLKWLHLALLLLGFFSGRSGVFGPFSTILLKFIVVLLSSIFFTTFQCGKSSCCNLIHIKCWVIFFWYYLKKYYCPHFDYFG